MGSKSPSPSGDDENGASSDVPVATGKSKGKLPKRNHKAEREKLKREHLNDLFMDLANALEVQENNGKAAVLTEAARLLKELFIRIETLKNENQSLLSESNYVTGEKNELEEENQALETQIRDLRSEIESKVVQSKQGRTAPLPLFEQSEPSLDSRPDQLPFPVAASSVQQTQPPAVFIVPVTPNVQAYNTHDTAEKPKAFISKPHARYPTASDSWPPFRLLKDCDAIRDEH